MATTTSCRASVSRGNNFEGLWQGREEHWWFLLPVEKTGFSIFKSSQTFPNHKSADPASPWPRQGGAGDHRRCGTLLSLKATVNCTTASDLLWASKTDGCIAPPSNPSGALATASVLLCGSKLTGGPCPVRKPVRRFSHCFCVALWFKTDGWTLPRPQTLPLTAPCLALWDFKTDGWPPVPIPKPSPQPRPP